MRLHEDEDAYAAECVAINPNSLNDEFSRLPADLAYWNSRYAEVYEEYLRAKDISEQTAANAAVVYRGRSTAKVTVAEVEAHVILDDDCTASRADEILAEAKKVKYKGIVDAVLAKKEMLISLGAHVRAEMGGDPSMRTQQYLEEQRAAASRF